MISLDKIHKQLILHEGIRLKPYNCTGGKMTIGVGRNLEDKGINREEALHLLANDIKDVKEELDEFYWFEELSEIRQRVIIDMAINLGVSGLLKFKKMITALKGGDYKRAAIEMLDSRWAKQVGGRADRLARMMETDRDFIKGG
ncbi:MAG: glycoside hydrolase family protein [Bacillota bacterium]